MPTNLPKNALHPLPPDERDFSFSGTFGSLELDNIPGEFYESELLGIKNQTDLDFCASFSSAEVSEDQEAVELDPYFPFQSAKKLLGGDAWKSQGLNLRDVCEAAIKIGFIEATQFPFKDDDRATERDFLANPDNWPDELDLLATDHKKGSYWDATSGPYDLFDNIRSAIFLNRFEHRSVIVGALFRPEWAAAEGGIIPKEYTMPGEGHAFKIFGWKMIGDEPYLVIVNSWGMDVGDGGLFYMPREVANKELTFGGFTYKDMTADDAKTYVQTGIAPSDPIGTKIWKIVLAIIARIFNRN